MRYNDPFESCTKRRSVVSKGVEYRIGARVRLVPRGKADAFDMVLAGRVATIESIEQDVGGRFHVAVSIDDDSGKDFGHDRKLAHCFCFALNEIEPLSKALIDSPGDIFFTRHRLVSSKHV